MKSKKNSSNIHINASGLNQRLLSVLLVLIIVLLLGKVRFVFTPIEEFISLLTFPVVLTLILYYIMKPIVDWLEKRRVKRILSITIIFTLFIAFIVLGSWTLFPMVEYQVETFAQNLPKQISLLNQQVESLLGSRLFQPIRQEAMSQISQINTYIQKYGHQASQIVLNSTSGFITAVEQTLLGVIMLPFMLFYLLKDDRKVIPAIVRKLPISWRKESESSLLEIHQKLSNYIRGQLIIALITILILVIAFAIIGLNYGITLALLAGFMNFLIPSFGALFVAIPACIIAFVQSPWILLWVALTFYIVQHIQSHFIAPFVLGNRLEIHPLTILILLIWSGEMFGFLGLILAIPLYASIRVCLQHTFFWYQRTSERYDDALVATRENEDETTEQE